MIAAKSVENDPAYIRDPIVREHLLEQISILESVAISTREALWRREDNIARLHWSQLRDLGRDIHRSMIDLEQIAATVNVVAPSTEKAG